MLSLGDPGSIPGHIITLIGLSHLSAKKQSVYSTVLANRTIYVLEWVVVIYEALCFDVAQGRMNGVPNETRTHLCRFASLAC